MTHRLAWLDAARGMAILLVIIGHSVDPAGLTAISIFAFHMPLFFMLSGYGFRAGRTFPETLTARSKSLLLPYLATAILLCTSVILYHAYVADGPLPWKADIVLFAKMAAMGSGQPVTGFATIPPIGTTWFLACLFVASLFFWAIWFITRVRTILLPLLIAIMAAIGWWLGRQHIFLPFSTDIALVALVFMYAGFCARTYGWFEKTPRFVWVMAALIALVASIYSGGISMNDRTYHFLPLTAAGAMGGSALILWCAQLCVRSVILCSVLTYIGQAALVILCFHVWDAYVLHMELWAPKLQQITRHPWPVLVLFRLAYSLAIYECLRRLPVWRTVYRLQRP